MRLPNKFAGWSQIPKKNYWNTKSTNQPQKILKKNVFRTSKVETTFQKFVWELPDGICSSNQNSKKIILTSNQPIRTKIFTK
jgi:hypothetical protein